MNTLVRPSSVFREYGLPKAILSDNGSPFGSPELGRLSRLSLWWIRLGVSIERIVPGIRNRMVLMSGCTAR